MRKGIAFIVAFALVISQFAMYIPTFAMSNITVTVTNPAAANPSDVGTGEKSEYSIAFDIDFDIDIGDVIKVKFPPGTSFVNTTIDKADVTVGGVNPTEDVSSSGTIASIKTPTAYTAGATITVVFSINAGVKNPSSQSGKYKLQVVHLKDLTEQPRSKIMTNIPIIIILDIDLRLPLVPL